MGIAAFHRARVRFILVDEYQDTSRSYYVLIKALTGAERNITCGGSPAPVATGMLPPTMPVAPKFPFSTSAMRMEPPRPKQ